MLKNKNNVFKKSIAEVLSISSICNTKLGMDSMIAEAKTTRYDFRQTIGIDKSNSGYKLLVQGDHTIVDHPDIWKRMVFKFPVAAIEIRDGDEIAIMIESLIGSACNFFAEEKNRILNDSFTKENVKGILHGGKSIEIAIIKPSILNNYLLAIFASNDYNIEKNNDFWTGDTGDSTATANVDLSGRKTEIVDYVGSTIVLGISIYEFLAMLKNAKYTEKENMDDVVDNLKNICTSINKNSETFNNWVESKIKFSDCNNSNSVDVVNLSGSTDISGVELKLSNALSDIEKNQENFEEIVENQTKIISGIKNNQESLSDINNNLNDIINNQTENINYTKNVIINGFKDTKEKLNATIMSEFENTNGAITNGFEDTKEKLNNITNEFENTNGAITNGFEDTKEKLNDIAHNEKENNINFESQIKKLKNKIFNQENKLNGVKGSYVGSRLIR